MVCIKNRQKVNNYFVFFEDEFESLIVIFDKII